MLAIDPSIVSQLQATTKIPGLKVTAKLLTDLIQRQSNQCALTHLELVHDHMSIELVDQTQPATKNNLRLILKTVAEFKQTIGSVAFSALGQQIYLDSKAHQLGNLYGSRTYLGGNLENVKEDPNSWRNVLTAELQKMGIICLSPTQDVFLGHFKEDQDLNVQLKRWRESGDYNKVSDVMKQVVQKDLRMVDIADFTIFNVDPDRPTWGTTHELIQAAFERKPILLLIESKKKTPLWFIRYIPEAHVFETIPELVSYLKGIHTGSTKLDTKLWKILHTQYRYI